MGHPCLLVNSYRLLLKKHHSVFLQWNILSIDSHIVGYPWFTSMTLVGVRASWPRKEDQQMAPAFFKPDELKQSNVSLAPQMKTSSGAPHPSPWSSWWTGQKHSMGGCGWGIVLTKFLISPQHVLQLRIRSCPHWRCSVRQDLVLLHYYFSILGEDSVQNAWPTQTKGKVSFKCFNL